MKSPVETSANGCLINTNSTLVRIDAGAARLFEPLLSPPVKNLDAAGCEPEQLDEMNVTRPASGPRRRNHRCRLQDGLPKLHGAAGCQGERLPAQPGQRRQTTEGHSGRDQCRDGVGEAVWKRRPHRDARLRHRTLAQRRTLAARGHTPGRTIYAVESSGAKMVVGGNPMHVAAVQSPDPTAEFDSDSKAAMPRRRQATPTRACTGTPPP